jgi:hypothetical protein
MFSHNTNIHWYYMKNFIGINLVLLFEHDTGQGLVLIVLQKITCRKVLVSR